MKSSHRVEYQVNRAEARVQGIEARVQHAEVERQAANEEAAGGTQHILEWPTATAAALLLCHRQQVRRRVHVRCLVARCRHFEPTLLEHDATRPRARGAPHGA